MSTIKGLSCKSASKAQNYVAENTINLFGPINLKFSKTPLQISFG